jgi:hypothetical protein
VPDREVSPKPEGREKRFRFRSDLLLVL